MIVLPVAWALFLLSPCGGLCNSDTSHGIIVRAVLQSTVKSDQIVHKPTCPLACPTVIRSWASNSILVWPLVLDKTRKLAYTNRRKMLCPINKN